MVVDINPAIPQVLCGHHPYLEIPSVILVVNAIMEGVRPEKPKGAKSLGFSDELWRIVEQCWLEDRKARPCVQDILSCLNHAVAFWDTRVPSLDGADTLGRCLGDIPFITRCRLCFGLS